MPHIQSSLLIVGFSGLHGTNEQPGRRFNVETFTYAALIGDLGVLRLSASATINRDAQRWVMRTQTTYSAVIPVKNGEAPRKDKLDGRYPSGALLAPGSCSSLSSILDDCSSHPCARFTTRLLRIPKIHSLLPANVRRFLARVNRSCWRCTALD